MKKKETIAEIRKTIKQLSVDPKEADTIKALEKQILNMNNCKHATNTGELVKIKGCKTCGQPTWIKCSNKKVVADRVKSGACAKCEHFEINK